MIVIETQHYNDGRTFVLSSTHTNMSEAEQKYHTVLAAAAVSSVDVHGAAMLNDDSSFVKNEVYYHGGLPEE